LLVRYRVSLTDFQKETELPPAKRSKISESMAETSAEGAFGLPSSAAETATGMAEDASAVGVEITDAEVEKILDLYRNYNPSKTQFDAFLTAFEPPNASEETKRKWYKRVTIKLGAMVRAKLKNSCTDYDKMLADALDVVMQKAEKENSPATWTTSRKIVLFLAGAVILGSGIALATAVMHTDASETENSIRATLDEAMKELATAKSAGIELQKAQEEGMESLKEYLKKHADAEKIYTDTKALCLRFFENKDCVGCSPKVIEFLALPRGTQLEWVQKNVSANDPNVSRVALALSARYPCFRI
jgi:hypothetical protein